ncbi:Metallo-hydrolase/oxidoreductase [Corynespora cassiicola Philippines]|uniref:Metallo-hydrolase/oxidoreductase n=1 Tax=Corynespora cassiicola Philippines TaxID=1448308 RepID=A0A2T2NZX4_CORCC|nr:Metallo-hydrolase/oxidoreductase [Corynespora cassiicola Philippines]
MCQIPKETVASSLFEEAGAPSYFQSSKLNSTTFLIIEADDYKENPFIYVKVLEKYVVLIDTGCGGVPGRIETTSLKAYIESHPLAFADNQPINPGGRKPYVIICSHSHFDHIGGIEQFVALPTTTVWASGYSRNFVENPINFPETSLCNLVGMKPPKYTVDSFASDGEHVVHTSSGLDLGLVIFHTPGHTPDQLAVWDPEERVLFVGDSLYEHVPIIFPKVGSVTDYVKSITRTRLLVEQWNDEGDSSRVTIAAGHITRDADAETLLLAAEDALHKILISNSISPTNPKFYQFIDEDVEEYEEKGSSLSFVGSGKNFSQARMDPSIVEALGAC